MTKRAAHREIFWAPLVVAMAVPPIVVTLESAWAFWWIVPAAWTAGILGLILVLGGYFVLLLSCRSREQGVVVVQPAPFGRYIRAMQAAMERLARQMLSWTEALARVSRTLEKSRASFMLARCANCGEPWSKHTPEPAWGMVCRIDAAARTNDERFTYTHPRELA